MSNLISHKHWLPGAFSLDILAIIWLVYKHPCLCCLHSASSNTPANCSVATIEQRHMFLYLDRKNVLCVVPPAWFVCVVQTSVLIAVEHFDLFVT